MPIDSKISFLVIFKLCSLARSTAARRAALEGVDQCLPAVCISSFGGGVERSIVVNASVERGEFLMGFAEYHFFRSPRAQLQLPSTITSMSADPINANPKILSHSDLPKRRPKHVPSIKGPPDSMLSRFFSKPQWTDPLLNPPAASDSESDDDGIVEPIDEQEIYGMKCLNYSSS